MRNIGNIPRGVRQSSAGKVALRLLGGVAVSAITSTLALAQTSTPVAIATQTNDVVVTAQKRSERLLSVPAPVTAITAADLFRTQAIRLDDLTAKIPGLTLIADREGETQIIIRGITTGTPVNSTVSTYIDDVPFGSSTNAALGGWLSPDLDPSDLQRIEVLRGPQGTLYGASSLGGLVKYVTAAPDLKNYAGRIELDGSTIDHGGSGYGVRLMANIPVIADTLAVRVSGYDRRDPGYIDNPNLGLSDVNRSLVNGGRVSALWTPLPRLSVNVSAVIQDLKNYGSSDEDVTLSGNSVGAPSTSEFKQIRYVAEPLDVRYRLYSATLNYDLQWANLVSVTSYSTEHEVAITDQTAQLGAALAGAFGLSNVGFDVGSNLLLHKATQEIRLESAPGSKLEWRVGGFFTHEHSDRDEPSTAFFTTTHTVIPLPGQVFFANLNSRYTEYAGFADLTYHFTPQFDVAGGIRYSKNNQHFVDISGGLAAGGTSTIAHTSSDDSTTFLITPRYKLDANNMIYARIASGYRPGGPNATTLSQIAAGVPTAYQPDTLTDYDLGYKANLLDHRLTLDLSAFHIDWHDIQITTIFNGISSSGNGGTARSDGFEGSAVYTPIHGLTLAGNLTYTDARLTENAPGVNGKSGDRLPNVAKWAAGFSADYDFPINGDTAGFVGASAHYLGDRVARFVSGSPATFVRPSLPSYTTVDLRAGITFKRFTFELYAKNVGDERGFNNVTSNANSGYQAPFSASLITPRTIGISVSAKY